MFTTDDSNSLTQISLLHSGSISCTSRERLQHPFLQIEFLGCLECENMKDMEPINLVGKNNQGTSSNSAAITRAEIGTEFSVIGSNGYLLLSS